MNNKTWPAKMLATAACCIAMSLLLSYVKLFSMPSGGSVTALSMLPLMVFAWLYGTVPGIVAGAAYGVLQFLQKPEFTHWIQMLLEYPIAFAAMGLVGVFRGREKAWALPAGVVLACFGRFLCHFLAGAVFFAEYAPTAGFVGVCLYSAGYNGGYMGAECVLTAAVAALPPVRGMIGRIAKM